MTIAVAAVVVGGAPNGVEAVDTSEIDVEEGIENVGFAATPKGVEVVPLPLSDGMENAAADDEAFESEDSDVVGDSLKAEVADGVDEKAVDNGLVLPKEIDSTGFGKPNEMGTIGATGWAPNKIEASVVDLFPNEIPPSSGLLNANVLLGGSIVGLTGAATTAAVPAVIDGVILETVTLELPKAVMDLLMPNPFAASSG